MGKSTKIIIMTVFFALAVNSADAQDTLTWEECVRMAKKNHPDLISAAEAVKQAEADLDIEVSAMLPDISGSGSGKRGKSAGGKTNNSYAWSVSGQQLIFDGFRTSSGVSNAFKAVQAQKYNYFVISSDIRLALRNAFVELLRTQELVPLTEQIAGRRSENLELVKLRYEAGREHKGSLLTAEADLAQAEFEVSQARRSVTLAQRELLKELGIGRMKPLKAKGEFSIGKDYSAKPDIDDLADTTPSLKELIARKEAARYNLQSAESDFFPQIYLDTSIGRSGATVLPRNKAWSAGMSVSLPLFEGGSRVTEVTKARSRLHQAQAEERSGRDTVLVTLEGAWKGLLDAIAKVEVEKKFLEADEERAKIAGAQYEKGLISFDDWVIIENNLVSSKKDYLTARAGMLSSEADWIQAIGGTLDYDQE